MALLQTVLFTLFALIVRNEAADVSLSERRPPIIYDNSTRSVVVSEYDPVEMECYAGGYPLPKITWRRENNAVLPTGGSIYRGNTLKIKHVRKEDRGTYYCVAENGVGKGTRRDVAVEVEFAPVVTVPHPRLGQALQYDMDLECHVVGNPMPMIVWFKDGVHLSNNQHYSISYFDTTDEVTDTTLRVIAIEKRHYGQYTCKAVNKIGFSEGRVELFEAADVSLSERRPPIIYDNSTRSVVVSEYDPVEMECYAGGYPLPNITWCRENDEALPTGRSIYRGNILKIKHVRKEDRGTYYCIAENGVGDGMHREVAIEVEFAPEVTVPRPRLGQALQYHMDLECFIIGYPMPAITWFKDEVHLSDNNHYSISHFVTAGESTDTILRVITIEKRQYGQYTCRAANKLGISEGKVELFESIIPVCPPACGQTDFDETTTVETSTE